MATEVLIGGETYRKRSPLATIGLILITLGIYGIYWHWRANEDARRFLRDDGIRPGIALLAVTLGVLVLVPPFVSIYRTGERIERMERQVGVTAPIEPVLFLLLHLVVGTFIQAWGVAHVNRALDAASRVSPVDPGELPPPPPA